MNTQLRADADAILTASIQAVLPDQAVTRALQTFVPGPGRTLLVAVGKAAWQMAHAALAVLGRVDDGIVITKYGHLRGELPGLRCREAGHPVPDAQSFAATEEALTLVRGLTEQDTVVFLLSGGGSALLEKPLLPAEELQDITRQLLACGADIVQMNTVRKRLSAVKGGRFGLACAPAKVFAVVLSDILGDPPAMIASGPVSPDPSTCAEARAIAAQYGLRLSPTARALLDQETPKALDNVTLQITGSVRTLCAAAASQCQALGYKPVLLTDRLCCQAREAGSFLASILHSHAGQGRKLAFVAGGETVVRLTGTGLGGPQPRTGAGRRPGTGRPAGGGPFQRGVGRHRWPHRRRRRLCGRRNHAGPAGRRAGRAHCAGPKRRLPRLAGGGRAGHHRADRHQRQ